MIKRSMQRAFSNEAARLHEAITGGQSVRQVQKAVRALVTKNGGRRTCLDEPLDEAGRLPLLTALRHRRNDIAALLLQEGASPNGADPSSGITGLIFACSLPDAAVVQHLLSAGADVDGRAKNRITALMQASQLGAIVVVHKLLSAGASVNLADSTGHTALMKASNGGQHGVVQQLLSAGAEPNRATVKEGHTALMTASFQGHDRVVQQLLSAGAEIEQATPEYSTALFSASFNGHHAVVQRLLSAGADPNHAHYRNASVGTPLVIAAQKGHHRITQLLLTAGANVNEAASDVWYPLCAASHYGRGIVVDQLIAAGAELEARIGEQGRTALMTASFEGHRSIVRKLLRAGAEVNTTSDEEVGAGAIHLASQCGHARVVEELIAGGAEVDMLDGDGATALVAASLHCREAVIRVLLSAGADPDSAGSSYPVTPLLAAAQQGHSGAALELLSGGASLAKALTVARGHVDGGPFVEFLLAADRHLFASQSALDLMRGTDRLFGKEGRLKVSQREVSPEVLQEVAEEMA